MNPDLLQFGAAGLVAALAWKILDKVPGFTNGAHKVTSALVTLSTTMEKLAAQSAKQTDYLRDLSEAHTGYDSKRPDGSYRWHNSVAREKDIEETREIVGELREKVAQEQKSGG